MSVSNPSAAPEDIMEAQAEAAAAAAAANNNNNNRSLLFDLEPLILQRYAGEARIQRLFFVGQRATSFSSDVAAASLAQTALETALKECMSSGNTFRYKEIYHYYEQQIPSLLSSSSSSSSVTTTTGGQQQMIPYPAAWLQDTEQQQRQTRDALQGRLQTAQAHLNKDAIRAAYTSLAQHAATTVGDLGDALHAVLRAKDYCTSRPQTATVSLQIVFLALLLQNYGTVREYVTKIEHTLGETSTTTTTTTTAGAPTGSSSSTSTSAAAAEGSGMAASRAMVRVHVWTAAGLERLASQDYVAAASKFRQVAMSSTQQQQQQRNSNVSDPMSSAGGSGSGETSSSSAAAGTSPQGNALAGSWESLTVLAPDEIALYAAILTLAVDDRSTMVNLAEHVEALELVPAARQALLLFGQRAQYQAAWSLLEESGLVTRLSFDVYLAPHWPHLQDRIRAKAMQLYWQAYQCVPLATMAQHLGTGLVPSTEALLSVVTDLIGRGALSTTKNGKPLRDTRIDLANQTLVRQSPSSSEEERLQSTQTKLVQLKDQVLDDAYSMVVRLACVELELVAGGGGDGGRGGRRRRGGGGGGGGRRHRAGGPLGHHVVDSEDEEEDEDDDEGGGGGGAVVHEEEDAVMYEGGHHHHHYGGDDDDAVMMDMDMAGAGMNPEDMY